MDLKIGFVDPSLWRSYPSATEPVDGFFEQTDAAMFAAQERIAARGGKVVTSVPLASWESIVAAIPDIQNMEELFVGNTLPRRCKIWTESLYTSAYQMKRLWPDFLAQFEGVPQSLNELIEFNKTHADADFTERSVVVLVSLVLFTLTSSARQQQPASFRSWPRFTSNSRQIRPQPQSTSRKGIWQNPQSSGPVRHGCNIRTMRLAIWKRGCCRRIPSW